MASAIKRHWKKTFLFVLLAICFILYQFHSERADLVATPSTHSQIKWLDIDDACWKNNCKVRCCLYDEECNYIQICLVLPNRNSFFSDAPAMRFFVDGREILDYACNTHSTWRSRYLRVLLSDIGEFETFRVEIKEHTDIFFEAHNFEQT